MKKLILFLALFSHSLYASIVIGSPNVEINSEGLYLVQIKISSTTNLAEDDISITNFKSNDDLSDFNFEFKIFENLQDYKRLTLALPSTHLEDYISFRLNIKNELKKDIFIFLPQNDLVPKAKSQVSFKLPSKKIYGEPQRYDLEKILSEESNYEDPEPSESNAFSLAKPANDITEEAEDPKSIPSDEVETIWSVSKSVSQNYDASIYQIMWGFYLENPNAFIDEDINRVRGDIDLALPSQELVASTSAISAKESVAFMDARNSQLKRSVIKPILKLTAPVEIFTDTEVMKDSINSSTSESQLDLVKEVDNSQLNASEIVEKNTSFIELKSQSDFSTNANTSKNSQAFDLRDLFWVGVLSLLLGFAIAYMLIRSSKRPTFTKAAVEEDLQDESNTFQTNLSISNDIETQELDLVRTYIEMDDWESATKILDKLIANSTNDLIVSEAYSLLKEKK
ncbi:MAG: FimV/HubP family polar landmark protein [SAR86 cluster bacterium]|nr:FimV/HubP family polar landmark protein [SAR86 cluster bacterium]